MLYNKRLFKNTLGETFPEILDLFIRSRYVKNAHLSYHWLIFQDVPYLFCCQIILLCKPC